MSYFWQVPLFTFQVFLPDCVLWSSSTSVALLQCQFTSTSEALKSWWAQIAGSRAGQLRAAISGELASADLFSRRLLSYHPEAFPMGRSDDPESDLPGSFWEYVPLQVLWEPSWGQGTESSHLAVDLHSVLPFSSSCWPLYPYACPPTMYLVPENCFFNFSREKNLSSLVLMGEAWSHTERRREGVRRTLCALLEVHSTASSPSLWKGLQCKPPAFSWLRSLRVLAFFVLIGQ